MNAFVAVNSCFIKPSPELSNSIRLREQQQQQQKFERAKSNVKRVHNYNPIHPDKMRFSYPNVIYPHQIKSSLNCMPSRFHPFNESQTLKVKQPRRSSLSETVGYQPLGSLNTIPSHHLPPTPSQSPIMNVETNASSSISVSKNPNQNQNGPSRRCSLCGTTETPLWRRSTDKKSHVCNACGNF